MCAERCVFILLSERVAVSLHVDMLTKTEAIVLRSLKYGENRLIINLLTESEGVVTVAVNMPKTQRGKLKRQLFQPLTLLSIELDMRQNRELQHLRDARISVPFASLATDPAKLGIALFLAEFLYFCSRGEDASEGFFQYIKNSILWLDGSRQHYANSHLVFMMRLSRFIGFMPNVDDYVEGDFFDMRNACFVRTSPLHPDYLSPEDASHVITLLRMNFETMHLFRLTRSERNRIVDIIILYYRLHVASFPELRSLDIVRELWA